MNKDEFYTVKELKETIRHMEKEDKLSLNGKILVYFKGRKREYGVTRIGHYSITPDITLEVKEIRYE